MSSTLGLFSYWSLMLERLQKILSQAGIASRREAERIITDGRVAVNGVVVTELGTKADAAKDRITVDGKPIKIESHKLYVLLYKPVGYMTTLKDPQGRPIVTDLLREIPERVYPVGRLDYNTEGLLILTNDGAMANMLMHPSHEVDKGYLVRVSGQASESQIDQLSRGVRLEDGMTAPAKVAPVSASENNSWISITIHEGRYRQVRRMCEAVGLKVVRLKRSRYDFLEIGELRPGQYRHLTPDEVRRLMRNVSPEKGRGKARPAPAGKRPPSAPGQGEPKKATSARGTGAPKRTSPAPGKGEGKRFSPAPGKGAPKRSK